MDEPMLQVRKISYPAMVNVVDGVPQCSHGDPMVETKPGEWMCPDGAALLPALNDAMARLEAKMLQPGD